MSLLKCLKILNLNSIIIIILDNYIGDKGCKILYAYGFQKGIFYNLEKLYLGCINININSKSNNR